MKRFTLAEAAERLGVSCNTLLRWEAQGKIVKTSRDRNGWRFYTEDSLAQIKSWMEKIESPLVKKKAAGR